MTQHHHTPPPDPMPLDPEERALAARLARLGPHGEPSPALDARVLAAAHAATSGSGAHAAGGTRRREDVHGWRRARWPVGIGVAASVVLAAGIAWQMRPLPAPVVPMAATATVAAASEVAQPSPMPPGPPPPETFATAAAPEATAVASKPADARAAVATKALAPPPPAEPAVVFDEPSPVDVQAPPPAPPAPPAPMAPMAPPMPAVAGAAPTAQKPQAARAATSATQAQAQAQEAPIVFDTGADAPEADVPPATAASPEVRDAWLARIRELAIAGRTDEARASLAEFRRRYPAFAIPADLHPLLQASPEPAPAPPSPSPQQ